jgi:hypothetical protein
VAKIPLMFQNYFLTRIFGLIAQFYASKYIFIQLLDQIETLLDASRGSILYPVEISDQFNTRKALR